MKAPTIYYYHCHQASGSRKEILWSRVRTRKCPSWTSCRMNIFIFDTRLQGGKGFCTLSLHSSKSGLSSEPTQRVAAAEMGLIFCGHPRQPAGWVPAVMSPVRTSSPALASALLSPRVLHSRSLYADPSVWDACSGPLQPNGKTVLGLTPTCPGSLPCSRAATALGPICTPQGSRDSQGALWLILYYDLNITGSLMASHSSWALLICSNWKRGFPVRGTPFLGQGCLPAPSHTVIRRRLFIFSCYKCKYIVRLWERRAVWFLTEISLIRNQKLSKRIIPQRTVLACNTQIYGSAALTSRLVKEFTLGAFVFK